MTSEVNKYFMYLFVKMSTNSKLNFYWLQGMKEFKYILKLQVKIVEFYIYQQADTSD